VSELRLYNTLTRTKERFEPLDQGRVRLYSCGPTVYSRAHLGNMRPYVFVDLLKRTLRHRGWTVFHVMNITDVGHLTDDADAGEDKMEIGARESGLSAWEVAAKWTRAFQQDIARLGVLEPDVWCRATDHIAEQIEMIRALEAKGFTYRVEDGVYFDTSRDPHYGELARLQLQTQQTQERIEAASWKRNPADFALWKLSPREGPRRQMEWESPWGVGFPGWHIECSAMSTRYLGAPFDIHTGGVDHIPVHHPNEIAQSENALGVRPWVRFWMHSAWMMFDEQKMAKSRGNVLVLDELEAAGIEPLAFRYFLLAAHYRQQINFSDSAIAGARAAYRRLVRHAVELRDGERAQGGEPADPFRRRFRDALYDDLNSPQALAVLWEALRTPELSAASQWELLCEFDGVLGLGLEHAKVAGEDVDGEVEALIEERERARAARDFARADALRDELLARGIVLEDTRGGTRWRRG
jgi:cysteinyl-tRNA synthetase